MSFPALVVWTVKNLPTMQETWVWSLDGEMANHWRRKWLTPSVFLPGESYGERSLKGYSPWGHKELDTTEQLTLSLLSFSNKSGKAHLYFFCKLSLVFKIKNKRKKIVMCFFKYYLHIKLVMSMCLFIFSHTNKRMYMLFSTWHFSPRGDLSNHYILTYVPDIQKYVFIF